MKSLAHPEWPYAGSAHEWRGFVKEFGGPRVVRVTVKHMGRAKAPRFESPDDESAK